MKFGQTTIALPVSDRPTSYAFYTRLGFSTVGEIADDGVPEPLQLEINDGLRVMFIPPGGFGWVTGGRELAPRDTSECLIVISRPTREEVEQLVDRAREAGAEIVMEPGDQDWGFCGVFADPDGHVWQVVVAGGIMAD